MNTIIEIAKGNGVTDIPSVLLLNNKGKPVKVVTGVFNPSDMEKAIDEVLNKK
ncbi:MAG TPA: hypothetical protein VEG39_17620 [Clostridia bacterium]|nr:hypothetical protein [Clostridia bacterium]